MMFCLLLAILNAGIFAQKHPVSYVVRRCVQLVMFFGACTTSLNQGRFTFRHDSVLTVIVDSLASFIKDLPPPPKAISIKRPLLKQASLVQK